MGLCRKLGKEAEAMDFANRTVQLVHELGMDQNITGATAFLNAGTVYKAFGKAAEGFHYFEEAKAIYEAQLDPNDSRLAGLYNNMALCCAAFTNTAHRRACCMTQSPTSARTCSSAW